MFIRQLYTGCLSEAAYYVESEGEAVIIDPLRDIDEYLELAKERKASIRYIFETHFHADFVSGHLDLSKATGAPIVYGPGTNTSFPVHIAKDGEVFQVGKLKLEVLHTPGHTLESSCYLLYDEHGKKYAVFTGDTLFVGDVGRPDLSQKGSDLTTQDLAGILYDSLQAKLVPLPDDVIVYPAHGPGSACGKNLGPNTHSTIGNEKAGNYALKADSRESFIREVTTGILPPPAYFSINARINKEGYSGIEEIVEKGMKPLSPQAFYKKISEEVIILDTRTATKFTSAFIPGAISIGLEGRFAEWAGSILSFDQPILLVTEPGKEKESIIRLARVGFDKMEGFLEGGMDAWQQEDLPIDMIIDIEPDELMMDIPFDDNLLVVDVRKPSEFADGHLAGAMNLPLDEMKDVGNIAQLDDQQNIYIHCAGGYRSVIAASLMKRQGYQNLRNVLGGWNKIRELEKVEVVKDKSSLN